MRGSEIVNYHSAACKGISEHHLYTDWIGRGKLRFPRQRKALEVDRRIPVQPILNGSEVLVRGDCGAACRRTCDGPLRARIPQVKARQSEYRGGPDDLLKDRAHKEELLWAGPTERLSSAENTF